MSVSRILTSEVVRQLVGEADGVSLTYRDLIANPLPYITFKTMPGIHPSAAPVDVLTKGEIAARALVEQALDEFLSSDVIILAVPMYNFGIPAQLKSWLDSLVVPGKTFAFSPDGPRGLAGTKRVILVVSRGGVYGPTGLPISMDHAESYVRCVLSLMGISNPELVLAEGVARDRAGAIDHGRSYVQGLAPL